MKNVFVAAVAMAAGDWIDPRPSLLGARDDADGELVARWSCRPAPEGSAAMLGLCLTDAAPGEEFRAILRAGAQFPRVMDLDPVNR